MSWLKYFSMKWRFRLDQARAIFGLVTFAALLAVGYIEYITFLENLGVWGVFIFTIIIFIIFVIGGYIYDRVLKLWSETQTVSVERNPYTWVPGPKEQILWLGWWAYLFKALNQIAEKLDVELEDEEVVRLHMSEYYKLKPSTPNFEAGANKVKKLSEYMEKKFLETGKIPDLESFLGLISEGNENWIEDLETPEEEKEK